MVTVTTYTYRIRSRYQQTHQVRIHHVLYAHYPSEQRLAPKRLPLHPIQYTPAVVPNACTWPKTHIVQTNVDPALRSPALGCRSASGCRPGTRDMAGAKQTKECCFVVYASGVDFNETVRRVVECCFVVILADLWLLKCACYLGQERGHTMHAVKATNVSRSGARQN